VKYFFSQITLIVALLSCIGARGQCYDFQNEHFSTDIIEVHLEVILEKKGPTYVKKAEADLKISLRREMSEKILSTVKSDTRSEVVEVNDEFSSYFDSHVDIQSASNLSYGTFSFCTDEKARRVFGRFTIDKLKLAKANYADCLSAIKGLNSEINAVYISSNSIDVSIYKRKLDDLNKHKNTSFYLNPETNVSEFDDYYNECQKAIAKLSKSQNQLYYEEKMGMVNDSLGVERYSFAIRTLRMLEKQFRNDPLIMQELESAEVNYKAKLKRDVLLYESNSRYEAALKEIDNYCALLSCENEIREMKTQLQLNYFDQIFVQLENAIEKGLETEIARFKVQIDKLKDVNIKKFIEIQNKCSDYERNKSIENTVTLYNQRDYQGAYNLLKELERTYGKTDSRITHLKKKVGSHIVRGMIKDEKHKRPFTYSLQLGTELFSNDILPGSFREIQISSVNFAYTAGLYKLYNFKKYSDHNSTRKVKSADFIGLKFTMFDYPSTFYTGLGDTAVVVRPNNYACQVGLDGISARFLHYSFGVKYQNLSTFESNWKRPNEYFGTLGIRVGIRKINWITDFGVRTQFQGKANFQISTGVYYRFDFNRKFGRRDRIECRSRLK